MVIPIKKKRISYLVTGNAHWVVVHYIRAVWSVVSGFKEFILSFVVIAPFFCWSATINALITTGFASFLCNEFMQGAVVEWCVVQRILIPHNRYVMADPRDLVYPSGADITTDAAHCSACITISIWLRNADQFENSAHPNRVTYLIIYHPWSAHYQSSHSFEPICNCGEAFIVVNAITLPSIA
jgi:hypothetical protein